MDTVTRTRRRIKNEYPVNVMRVIMNRFDRSTYTSFIDRSFLSPIVLPFAADMKQIYAPNHFNSWYREKHSDDFEDTFSFVLDHLGIPARDKKIFTEHFRDNVPCSVIAENVNITRARIYQIIDKAINNLTLPDNFILLYFGNATATARKEEYYRETEALLSKECNPPQKVTPGPIAHDPEKISIDDMPLNNRTRSILDKNGIHTAKDIISTGIKKIGDLPGIGVSSVENISDAMWCVGFLLDGTQTFVKDNTPGSYLRITDKSAVFDQETLMEALEGLDGARACVISAAGFYAVPNLGTVVTALRSTSSIVKKLCALSRMDFDYPRQPSSKSNNCNDLYTAIFFNDELSADEVAAILRAGMQDSYPRLVITAKRSADLFLSSLLSTITPKDY